MIKPHKHLLEKLERKEGIVLKDDWKIIAIVVPLCGDLVYFEVHITSECLRRNIVTTSVVGLCIKWLCCTHIFIVYSEGNL